MRTTTITQLCAFLTIGVLTQKAALTCLACSEHNMTDFGICYGTLGNNLPTVDEVIELYQTNGVKKIRLFDPMHTVLEALSDTDIEIALGVKNEDLALIASDSDAAAGWVRDNILTFPKAKITYISVGNEVVPFAGMNIVYAMMNIHDALVAAGLPDIKVTTVVHLEILGLSYPPSQGSFTNGSTPLMKHILSFLNCTGFPLMVNVYPYFAYAANSDKVNLEYALCAPGAPVVNDGDLVYPCMIDAMVDAFNSAMEKLGYANVFTVISEVGWPNAGNGNFTTPELARQHNVNTLEHVIHNGTPKRPDYIMPTFFFAMFNENLKPFGIEQHWGFFYPNKTPVYKFFNN